MSKLLRISDELYAAIAKQAKEEQRSIAMMGQVLLGAALNRGLGKTVVFASGDITPAETARTPQMETQTFMTDKGPKEVFSLPPVKKLPDHLIGRSTNGILLEINAAETQRTEDLAFCQDEDTRKQIIEDSKAYIDSLWAEYHELKGE